MNQQNQSFLVQFWANIQNQDFTFLRRDRLSDQYPKHYFVDVCGGA